MFFSSVYCINIEARYFHQTTTLFSKRVIEGLRDIALIGSKAGGTRGGGHLSPPPPTNFAELKAKLMGTNGAGWNAYFKLKYSNI